MNRWNKICNLSIIVGWGVSMNTSIAKTASTYYTDRLVDHARRNSEHSDWGKTDKASLLAACTWHMDRSLDDLWELVPPAEQLRAINVCHGIGCPDCGERIFRVGGHYPWKLDRARPYQVICPVCERAFPEVPFQPWNPVDRESAPETGTPIADRGVGWQDDAGHRYYFVAYYLFWQRWRQDIVRGAHLLGRAYLLSGDAAYARRAGVLLAAIAQQYPRFQYETQVYHEGIWNVRGRISDYIWSTGDNSNLALAYDAVFPLLKEDPALRTFLREKGVETPCDLIETNMLQVMVDDIMRGYVAGNMGMHQKTLCELAIVLDNHDPNRGTTMEQMRAWLLQGNGRVEDLLWNGFWRDGLGGESAPGYAMGWGHRFYDLADLLPRLGADIWANPRLRKIADIALDLTVAGEFTPCIGDCGGVQGAKRVGWSAKVFGSAFARYGDPRYAAALRQLGARNEDLWDEVFDEAAVAAAPAEALAVNSVTRNLGGYGLAILESGGPDNRRAVTLYYGDASTGHGHRDRLTLGFFALGYPMFPEMGYPTPFRTPRRFGWTSNSLSHYTVVVDQTPQQSLHRGSLQLLASVPQHIQVARAAAENVYPNLVTQYRRTTCLIDIPDSDHGYVLDVFEVRGGSQHDWSFHGPAFSEFAVAGGECSEERPGTLAGPDIPFGGHPHEQEYGKVTSGYEWLEKVRTLTPNGPVRATWRNPEDDAALTTLLPQGACEEFFLAVGQPEMQKGNPEAIYYLIGRRQAADGAVLESVFVSVSEAHRGAAQVQRIERLDTGDHDAIGVCVVRQGGRDVIHLGQPGKSVSWKSDGAELTADAGIAIASWDARGLRRLSMIDGSRVGGGGVVLAGRGPGRGVVEEIDLQGNTVLVTCAGTVANPVGKTVIFGNDAKQAAFTVVTATPVPSPDGRHLLRLGFGDVLLRVGMGPVQSLNGAAGEIVAARELTGYGRIDAGRHAGRWLYGADQQAGFRIREVRKNAFLVAGEPERLAAVFSADNPAGNVYWISDVGPGDWVHIPDIESLDCRK